MNLITNTKQPNKKIIFSCILISSFLQWFTYQLLIAGKLGSIAECYALAQTFVVLIVAPYLAALSTYSQNCSTASIQLQLLSPISLSKHIFKQIVISLYPLVLWIFFSIGFALAITDISVLKSLKMLSILLFYTFSTGAIGMCGAFILKDTIFGTVCAYFLTCLLIGSAFFILPLARYVDNIQPLIQPVLHLNPLIAVCNIFDGMDIFRVPLLYDLTPITDYDYSYPSWYIISFWHILLGGCCFLGTWLMCRSNKFVLK